MAPRKNLSLGPPPPYYDPYTFVGTSPGGLLPGDDIGGDMGQPPAASASPFGPELAGNAGSFLSAIGMALMSSPRNAPLSNLPSILPGLMQAQQKQGQQRRVMDYIQSLNRGGGPSMPGVEGGGGVDMMNPPVPTADSGAGAAGNAGLAAGGAMGGGVGSAGGPLDFTAVRELAKQVGFQGPAADKMAAIVMAESGGNPNAIGDRNIGGSYGLTQIHEPAHGAVAREALGNSTRALQLGYDISKGGTDFTPWTMFKNGGYLKYMPVGGVAAQATPIPTQFGQERTNPAKADIPVSAAAAGNAGTADPRAALQYAQAAPQTATDATPDAVIPTPRQAFTQAQSQGAFADIPQQQTAQARGLMPNRAEPRNPETVTGARSQSAAAQRYFDHWSQVMAASSLLGDEGKGLMEAAKLRSEFALKFMTPTDAQRNLGVDLFKMEQGKRLDLQYAPQIAGQTKAAEKQAEFETYPKFKAVDTAAAIATAQGTPATETKEYEAYVADAKGRGQTPLSLFDWGQQRRRAQNQAEFGAIPPDYRMTRGADGSVSMTVIPGSPTERKAGLEQGQRRQAANIVVEDANRAEKLISEAILPTTGPGGALLSRLPGTASHDVSNLLDTMKANTSFDKLQQMRSTSPTGAALGAVSDFENKMLQATLGALAQSQTQEQFLFNLRRVKDIYLDIIDGPNGPHRAASAAPAAPGAGVTSRGTKWSVE